MSSINNAPARAQGETHTLEQYLAQYPDESQAQLYAFLAVTPRSMLASRKNPIGHLTASALVLSRSLDSVLLIHHQSTGLWLPPGGHVDSEVATLDVSADAIREAQEETGLTNFEPHRGVASTFYLLDIDTHPIASRPSKGEDAHVHHDLMYLAIADDTVPLVAQEGEVLAARWVPLSELRDSSIERQRRVWKKLQALL